MPGFLKKHESMVGYVPDTETSLLWDLRPSGVEERHWLNLNVVHLVTPIRAGYHLAMLK
jgi:hypothetical protein